MSTIRWKFENLPTEFETPIEKFQTTVDQLRYDLRISHKNQIQILYDGSKSPQPVSPGNGDRSRSGNPKKRPAVSKHSEATEDVAKTSELRDLSGDLDDSHPDADLLQDSAS